MPRQCQVSAFSFHSPKYLSPSQRHGSGKLVAKPISRQFSKHQRLTVSVGTRLVFAVSLDKGSSITYRRDFLVSDLLDSVADFIIGAQFMLEQWSVLFGKMKKMIADGSRTRTRLLVRPSSSQSCLSSSRRPHNPYARRN